MDMVIGDRAAKLILLDLLNKVAVPGVDDGNFKVVSAGINTITLDGSTSTGPGISSDDLARNGSCASINWHIPRRSGRNLAQGQ